MKTTWSILFMFFPTLAIAVPPSPELEKTLKEEGRWENVVKVLKQGKERDVDLPNPKPLRLPSPLTPVNQPVIVLLADFSDNVAITPQPHYDTLLFSQGIYPTGSMTDYFLENSYGAITMTGASTTWLRMPQNYTYYTDGQYGFGSYPNNAQRLTEDALAAADPSVNFANYDGDGDGWVDALFVVHAGPGAEVTGDPNDIWSHAWGTSAPIWVDGVRALGYAMMPEDGRIGVFCHEAGHSVFGLPDLYDTDYSSRGLGYWSLMAGGSWGNGGRTPVHMDGWSKVETGFVAPTVPTGDQTGVIFPLVEVNPVIYELWTNGLPTTQYFLVENRQATLFDSYIRGEGIIIYHVDESVGTGNTREWYPGYTSSGHYLVAVEQADSLWELERNIDSGDGGDPFPGTRINRTFDDGSRPDSKDYDFNSTGVCVTNISNSGDTMTADLCVQLAIHNVGVISLDAPIGNRVYTDSTYPVMATVQNFGTEMETLVVIAAIGGYGDTLSSILLASGADSQLTFAPWTVPSPDSTVYTMRVCATISADRDTMNNCSQKFFLAYTPVHDGGVTTITAPDTVFTDSSITPQATVRNFGTFTETFDVSMTIDGYADTVIVSNLAPRSSRAVSFSPWIVPPTDSFLYTMTTCTHVSEDTNTANDCQSKFVFAYNPVGVEEETNDPFPITNYQLYQNHPNPFSQLTVISYQIPLTPFNKGGTKGDFTEGGTKAIPVRLEIYDLTGRLVEILVNESQEQGVYQVPLSRNQLPGSGLYFVRLKVGNFIATKKMTLLH